MEISGVRIDNLEKKEILEKIESFLARNKFSQIATVNPEFILQAQKDEEFKNILNGCDLNVADGVGIKFAFWRYGQKLKTRIAGIDLMMEILKIADDRGLGVYLAANKNGLSSWEETASIIKKKYQNIGIGGINIDFNIPYEIQNFNPPAGGQNSENYEVILCSFGAPFQEKFLHSLKSRENGNIKLAMGVGGSFDYLTGKIKRAPAWMRKIGLEWLFRLILEPRYRIKKIFNAVIIFPIKIIHNSPC